MGALVSALLVSGSVLSAYANDVFTLKSGSLLGNFDLPLARQYWPSLNLGLGLNKKALVAELEAQAKWAIDNKLVRPDAKIPDFNTIVVGDFLPAAR